MARVQIAFTSSVQTVISTLNQSLWTEKLRDLGEFRGNKETSLNLVLYIIDSCHRQKINK